MLPEIRLHDAAVPVRHVSLTQVKRDVAWEIPVDFYNAAAVGQTYLWTSVASWMRVKIGAGAYAQVGDSLQTSVDLGAFTAGETKAGTIEIKVPLGADVRQQVLVLNLSNETFVAVQVQLDYILRDEFTTDDAAPITSPRTCEPGPGTMTIVDTGNNADIVGGEFKATGLVGPRDPGFKHDRGTSTEHVGLAVFGKIRTAANSDRWRFGFDGSDTTAPNNGAILKVGTTLVAFTEQGQSTGYMDIGLIENTASRFLIVRRSGGNFFIVDGKLWRVGNAETLANNWAIFAPYNAASDTRCDDFSLIDLPDEGYTEWDEDFSTVTDSESAPSAKAILCEADFHLRGTNTYETGKAVRFSGRYVDVNNYGVRASLETDGKLSLTHESGGSAATLFRSGVILSDGVSYQVDLVVVGTSAYLYLDNVLMTTQTLSYFLTQTGGYVNHNLVTNDIVLTTHPYPALGIATDRLVAPQASETATHEVDLISYCRNVTLPTSGSIEIYYRYTDSDNHILLSILSNGDINIWEMVEGVNLRIINGAVADVSDGDDVSIMVDGSDLSLFVGGTQIGTTVTTNVTSGTIAECQLLNDGVMDSIEFFPCDVASILPSELV